MSLRQLQPLSQGQLTGDALGRAETELATVVDGRMRPDPIEPRAFLATFGIGPAGASLVRPDGYVAWLSTGFQPII